MLDEHLAAQAPKKPETPICFGNTISMDEVLHAICSQFDMMTRAGQMRPIPELRNVLTKWDAFIKQKGGQNV